VDIGASLIHITALNEGMPYIIKEEPIGGQRLSEDIEDTFNLPPDEAEAVKLGTNPAPDGHAVNEVVERIVSNWLAAIERAVDNVKSEVEHYQLNKIILAGGSANLTGLTDYVQNHFGVPVEIFNPLRYVSVNSKKFDQSYVNYIGPQMAVSFGLAIRKQEIS
jgi:type IV pilus assembly protein PilM